MTNKERLIISAYTGVLMTDFSSFHRYAEELLGKPIWTHEFAQPAIYEELKEKTKEDFLALCVNIKRYSQVKKDVPNTTI